MSERGSGLIEALAATALAGLLATGALIEARNAARALASAVDRSDMLTLARNLLEQAVALPCSSTPSCPAKHMCDLERVRVATSAGRAGHWLERLEVHVGGRADERAGGRAAGVSLTTVVERASGCNGAA